MGVVMMAVDKITAMVQETARLAKIAQDISVSRSSTREISLRSSAVGADDNSIFASIDASAKARADALAGEPTAIAAFERLNISLEKIKDLAPDELFFRITETFKGLKLDAGSVVSSRRILGSNADELMPFFVAGTNFRFTDSERLTDSLQPGDPTWTSMFKRWFQVFGKGGVNPYKADLDPVSTYPLEREQATMRLRENNGLRADAIARSQLSTEEQITDLVRQRLELNRLIELESSEFRKEQLRSKVLDTQEQIIRLRAAMDQAALKATNPASSVLNTRNIDELYRSGIFTGGRPTDLVDTVKRQLDEQKISNQLLRNLPLGIAKKI